MNVEEISAVVVDAAFHLHKDLGPGLLESVYEAVLARILEQRGLKVEQQKVVAFDFHEMHFDEGLRVDLFVNDCLVVELKSVETLAPVHCKQLLTYLRLLNLPLGLLLNFGSATFKEGIKRVVNNHQDFAPSREPFAGRYTCLNNPAQNAGRKNPSSPCLTDKASPIYLGNDDLGEWNKSGKCGR
jgi:GxxExxY protein